MVKKMLPGLLALTALVLIFAVTRLEIFRVERSIAFKAQSAKVYALFNDFHQFPSWSPWQNMDATVQTTHSGAPSGQDAVYAWTGNDAVGAGRMEIL